MNRKIGLLHTGIREEEKLLKQASSKLKAQLDYIDVRDLTLNPENLDFWRNYDVFLERCISTVKGNAVIEFLDNLGLPVINTRQTMSICNDKFQTAVVLAANKIPYAKSILVFSETAAKQAVEQLGGFPVVIKSRFGSWGRLMAKVNDIDSLEGVFAHRQFLSPDQQATIVQEYIAKNEGRDIRAFVINDECVCAIYRTSEHWITNTARGGVASNCEITTELREICKKAAEVLGGGILAFDLFETDSGFIINEVNHTMEFKNSEKPTGVSISSKIIEYCLNYK